VGVLAVHHDLAGAPIDVVQRQRGDFSDAHAEPAEEQEHGEIAATEHGRLVARVQQTPHLIGLESFRQRRQSPARRGRDRVGQRARHVPIGVQEPQ
jgi:hypothetical protein